MVSAAGTDTKCFAKWSEDNVYYNAEIQCVKEDGFMVLFRDYGNSDFVKTEDVVFDSSKIPMDAEKDEHIVVDVPASVEAVPPRDPASAFNVGDSVIAKWRDDNVWYNARILEVGSGTFRVIFVDYGKFQLIYRLYYIY